MAEKFLSVFILLIGVGLFICWTKIQEYSLSEKIMN